MGTNDVRWLACGLGDVPVSAEWLSPAESARLASLRFPKRRSELRLARWTAKRAIARALDLDDRAGTLALIEVRAAPSGAPRAFLAGEEPPVAVSLSDRADWAVCVVAPVDLGVGCDLEVVEGRSDVFVRDWFTPREQRLVFASTLERERQILANLVWSAKESALKVLQTGLRRDTRSVEVDLTDRGRANGWVRLVVRAEEGMVLPGWWRRYGEFLLTVVADGEAGAPVPLEEPPGLAGATPSHSWLAEQ